MYTRPGFLFLPRTLCSTVNNNENPHSTRSYPPVPSQTYDYNEILFADISRLSMVIPCYSFSERSQKSIIKHRKIAKVVAQSMWIPLWHTTTPALNGARSFTISFIPSSTQDLLWHCYGCWCLSGRWMPQTGCKTRRVRNPQKKTPKCHGELFDHLSILEFWIL